MVTAPADAERPLRAMRVSGLVLAGSLVVAAFFGGFGAWAALAPLDSAAIAPGVLTVLTQRKTLQHLEGGIVSEILVDEATEVRAGEVVLRLDATQSRIRHGLLVGQLRAAEARAARLVAERDGLEAVTFPPGLVEQAHADSEIQHVLDGQVRIFTARREQLANREAILARRVRQLEEEIAGMRGEIATQDRALTLMGKEMAAVRSMVQKGIEPSSRLLALERDAARIEGERAQNRAAVARAEQRIGETRLQVDDLRAASLTEVVAELREVETEIADLRERIAAAEDVLRRTEVIAPVSGVVVNLQVHTPGGVIAPGEPLMDLVPGEDSLIIEARLLPTDIDSVHPGLSALVRLTAFKQRSTPSFEGVVRHVSADRLVDPNTGESFYKVRVALVEGQVGLDELTLHPGMPAEVMIRTGERTLFSYLMSPIVDSFGRALREQ
ncbi:MAG: HlyD family type I secretion periplasmic adaptor subunit [Ectothiorhodospiraceae bacterium]|nr:HlyD family type I secretion periplasmic adaptor subunit [Ectothiorhodospiraceae bacterium]